jgi:hypothetical protein
MASREPDDLTDRASRSVVFVGSMLRRRRHARDAA